VKIYLQYMVMTPTMNNEFASLTHRVIYHYLNSENRQLRHPLNGEKSADCHIAVVTQAGHAAVSVRGPEVSNGEASYAIYLPDPIADLVEYLTLLAIGFKEIFRDFSADSFLSACAPEPKLMTE
jgi:hypothetical protein